MTALGTPPCTPYHSLQSLVAQNQVKNYLAFDQLNMIIANGALQLLVKGSPANGGIIIIPEHFKAAAAAAAEVRRGLYVKKLTSLMSCYTLF